MTQDNFQEGKKNYLVKNVKNDLQGHYKGQPTVDTVNCNELI